MTDPWLTIGIEEEFQIVDASGQLKSHIDILVAAGEAALGEQLKPEMLQSAVELTTRICANIGPRMMWRTRKK